MIAQKQEEKGTAPDLDWAFHDAQLKELEGLLDGAFAESPLPAERGRQAIHQFLVDCRLGRASAV